MLRSGISLVPDSCFPVSAISSSFWTNSASPPKKPTNPPPKGPTLEASLLCFAIVILRIQGYPVLLYFSVDSLVIDLQYPGRLSLVTLGFAQDLDQSTALHTNCAPASYFLQREAFPGLLPNNRGNFRTGDRVGSPDCEVFRSD